MAIKTHKVTLSLDNPRVIQSGINVQSFDKQSIQISIELTKNDEVFQVPSDATIRVSLLKLSRQEQKIIVDVPNTNRESIDWIVPDYLDGYQGTVRVGVYLVSGTENVDLGYFTILSNVSDIDKMADEFTDNVFQGWEQIEADLNELKLTIAQTKLDLAEDLTQVDNTIANINAKNTQVNTLASDFTADVATKQADVTSKYNAFDTDITEANQTIDDILALQPQFQAVLDETTGKDVISAPEIILARGGAQTLGERLDSDKAEVSAQLAQNEELQKYQRNAERPLHIPTYDGGGETVHPHVMYFPNNWNGYKYWMAHTPYPNTNDSFENPSISVSHDGVQWFDPTGIDNPIDKPTDTQIADGYHMSDTHLVYRDDTNTLECWYRINKNGVIDQLLRKTSTDGTTWSEREVVHEVTGNTLTLSPAIIWDGTVYKMWYVSNTGVMSVLYKQSTTGAKDSWSTRQICTLNYRKGEIPLVPWHIDVSYSDSKYIMALNAIKDNGLPTSTRILLVGESTDGLTFNDLNTILIPTPYDNTTNWDNVEIYRSVFVKVGDTYRLYYSALGRAGGWKIGMLVGDTPYSVNRIDVTREPTGNTINLNDIILNKGDTIFTQETKLSFLNSKQLKFLIPLVAGASLKLNEKGEIEVLRDNDTLGMLTSDTVSSSHVVTNRIHILKPGATLTLPDKTQVVGTAESPLVFKLVNLGSSGLNLTVPRADTLAIRNDANNNFGFVEVSGLIMSGGLATPNIAGAVRYNSTTKKHEGFDGINWNPFY